MSQQLINHNPDLKQLRDEGFEVEIRYGYLLIGNVPYVNSHQEIKRGVLVSELTMAPGDKTAQPSTHVVRFAGEHPCHKDGTPINIVNEVKTETLGEGLVVNFSFSNKPHNGYANYYEKMTAYIAVISDPANSLDDTVTAKTFKVIESNDDGVFRYIDTSSSRADINIISDKLKNHKIGIIGMGGTGSYILDLVAKTPVKEIHIFDGDKYFQHNAFRSPGAPSVLELKEAQKKVDYFAAIYSKMHKNIIPHGYYINSSNIDQLPAMDFVFICLDKGNIKKLIFEKLEERRVSFIDVGMGVLIVDQALIGMLRITTSTEKKSEHVTEKDRVSFSDEGNDDYARNIQIADLNALNAALAVIKWKKLCGFYQDLENEHHSTYSLNVNQLLSEDQS